jgi:hypothetical protein
MSHLISFCKRPTPVDASRPCVTQMLQRKQVVLGNIDAQRISSPDVAPLKSKDTNVRLASSSSSATGRQRIVRSRFFGFFWQ